MSEVETKHWRTEIQVRIETKTGSSIEPITLYTIRDLTESESSPKTKIHSITYPNMAIVSQPHDFSIRLSIPNNFDQVVSLIRLQQNNEDFTLYIEDVSDEQEWEPNPIQFFDCQITDRSTDITFDEVPYTEFEIIALSSNVGT